MAALSIDKAYSFNKLPEIFYCRQLLGFIIEKANMGDLKFPCKQCGQDVVAADNLGGQEIQCPSCKETVAIPLSAEIFPKAKAIPVANSPELKGPPANVKETGGGRNGGARKQSRMVGIALLAVILIVGFIFRGEIQDRWNGHQKHEEALALMRGNQWEKAMEAAHKAGQFCPTSAAYRQTYVESRRNFLQETKTKLNDKDPLQFVCAMYEISTRLSPDLEDEGVNQLHAWAAEREGQALDQAAQVFDSDMAQLNGIFKGRENSFGEMFSPGAQSRARNELSAYINLAAAQSAWETNRPELTAAALQKVPADFRKSVFDALQKNLDGFRDGLMARLEAAKKLAVQEDFIGAAAMLAEVKKHEDWVPELREARLSIQRQGEVFYAKKIVESNLAREYKGAGEWLRKLLVLRGQKTEGIDFDSIFKGGTTADFLRTLTSVGLHPARPQDRKDFTDVLLVVADLDNLTDVDEAHKFLGNAYLEWASGQAEAGKFQRACYLALLAQKHGSTAAAALFDKAHADLMKQFTVAISVAPPKFTPKLASSDMRESLYSEATIAVRKNLPPWIRYEDPETPLDGTAPHIKVKLLAGLDEMTSSYEPNVREESREIPVEVVVDNPAYSEAVDRVQDARDAYQRQVDSYNALVEQANNGANSIAAGGTALAASFANLDRGINSAILQGAHSDVDKAKSDFERAQSRLNQTPRQTKEKQERTFTWEETDHITHFRAVFSVGLGVEDRVFWTRTIASQADHKSVSRRANDRIGLAAIERESPDLDKIQSVLASDMKPNIRALCTSTDFARQIKAVVGKYVAENSPTGGPEALQDAVLETELAWWDTPLRDYKALADQSYLGEFGDVIVVP